MSQHHPLSLLTLAAFAALIAVPAQAQNAASESYYYLGIGGGQSRANDDNGRVSQSLLGAGVTPLDIQHHGRHSAYKVFGGYQFNRYWGAELGFFKLGRYGFDATTSPAGTLSGEYRVQGMNADLVGTMPLTENLSALGRVGVTYARTRADFNGTGAVVVANPSMSDREANAKIGLGLQYAIGNSLLVRGEIENYRVSDTQGKHNQVAMYSVSLVMPFGRAPTATRTTYVAPAYVAPAPAPQPVIVVVPAAAPAPVVVAAPVAPPPVERRRVSYSAASLFGFDQSALRPEGKAALDTFAGELAGARFENVTVEGHTDRLGTTAYNQTLSQSRADAVKTHLVAAGHIDPAKITAVGKGESQPVTQLDQCKGGASAKVIACLQPDRRVVIEVAGSR